MVDEITDVSNQEQTVFCLHWVDHEFEVHEEFIRLHTIDFTDASHSIAYTNKHGAADMAGMYMYQIWSSRACLSPKSKGNLHTLLCPHIKLGMWGHH